MTNLINLANVTDNAQFASNETMLLDLLQEVRSGQHKDDRALILWVDRTDGQFKVCFTNAGLRCSDMLAACEIMKARCLAMMGYVNGPDSEPEKSSA